MNEESGKSMMIGKRGLALVLVLGQYAYLVECEKAGYAEFEKLAATEDFAFCYYDAFSVK